MPNNGTVVQAGDEVKKGDVVGRLVLLPPEEDLLSAEKNVALRKIELDVAQAAADRTEQLLTEGAASVKQLQQAQADLAAADAALSVSHARLEILMGSAYEVAGENLSSLHIVASVNGIIRKIHTSPGQTVAAGAKLIEIAGTDPVWIQVPVYVGDIDDIDGQKPARVHSLSNFSGTEGLLASPVAMPFSADPQNASISLYFELENSERALLPGQRVSVTLSLLESEDRLVLPYAALLYDMYGGTWVYENTGPQTFTRKRIAVQYVEGDRVVLTQGPAAGSAVVTAGAVELFGTEFGGGK